MSTFFASMRTISAVMWVGGLLWPIGLVMRIPSVEQGR